RDRDEGPARGRDRPPARAREARRRPLLLREPDVARDRRGARRDGIPRLAAAHEGSAAAEVAPAGGRRGGRAALGRFASYAAWAQAARPRVLSDGRSLSISPSLRLRDDLGYRLGH